MLIGLGDVTQGNDALAQILGGSHTPEQIKEDVPVPIFQPTIEQAVSSLNYVISDYVPWIVIGVIGLLYANR